MKRNKFKKIIRIIFLYIPVAFLIFSLSWVALLKWVPVYYTPLMMVRSFQNIGDKTFSTHKKWVPIDKISLNMVMAVIASEDNKFDEHFGFDFKQIDKALDDQKKGKRLRGASTISQQTAKNVFCLPTRSFVRKGFEAYYTLLIELIWGKERIMEVYLNVAEMGRGIYGAESAAVIFFHTHARILSSRQAALIAACLPNPLKRKANAPSNYLSLRASSIQSLMNKVPRPEWKKY
jgi:monofunctional glycosyltransferase